VKTLYTVVLQSKCVRYWCRDVKWNWWNI